MVTMVTVSKILGHFGEFYKNALIDISQEQVYVFGPNKCLDHISQVCRVSWNKSNDLEISPSRSNSKVKGQILAFSSISYIQT